MYNLFLEDCDLLESVELNMLINESYIEESVKLDKNKLNDMDYVRSIIDKIKNNKDKKKSISNALMYIGLFSIFTVVLIPASILLFVLSDHIARNADEVELKDLEKVNKIIEKSITNLNKQYESSSDKNEKKELKNSITKLEKVNKEITLSIDKIKNPLKYKKKDKDAVKALDDCISKFKELLSKPKYSDLKNAIKIDAKITGDNLYNDFIWGDENYLDIGEYNADKLNKLVDSGKYKDWDDILDLMEELMTEVNKSLKGKYELWFSEDSDIYRGGFAIMTKSRN